MTNLAPVMSWHVELTAASGAKTLTTGDVGGRRATVDQITWSRALHAPVNSEQSPRTCTGPAQERPASATRCEVNVSGRG